MEGRGCRRALFKRIEEEKGLGGWAPAPRRGIQTVEDHNLVGPEDAGFREMAPRSRQNGRP